MNPQIIELLQQIQELAGVGIEALSQEGGGQAAQPSPEEVAAAEAQAAG